MKIKKVVHLYQQNNKMKRVTKKKMILQMYGIHAAINLKSGLELDGSPKKFTSNYNS